MKSGGPLQIISLGELMLRLTPYFHREKIIPSDALRMSFAGAESNTSIALAFWGHPVFMITSLPDNILGDKAMAYLHQWNIHTDHVQRNAYRMGTYYIEHGVSIRPTQVLYDRADSAFAKTHPDLYEWEYLFQDKQIFYLTGITPALSENAAQACRDALREAKRQGLTVFFDPNYRQSLWNREDASNVIKDFLPYIDVLIANVGSACDVFNYQPGHSVQEDWNALQDEAKRAAKYLQQYTHISDIALSIRQATSAHKQTLGGIYWQNGTISESRPVAIEVVDRLGGGDAFAAGIIHGWIQQWQPATVISFATASAAIQQTQMGDLNLISAAEIMKIASGENVGDVKR